MVPGALLVETARRLNAVASLPFRLSPYRDRVVTSETEPAVMLGDELLQITPPAMSFSFSHWGPTSLRPRSTDQTMQLPSEVRC
jgi:hypothetical protein